MRPNLTNMTIEKQKERHRTISNSQQYSGFNTAIFLLLSIFSIGLHAQPEVTFEFESTFGQTGFYDPGPLGSTVNAIPPNGFLAPTGIAFQTATRVIIADQGNKKLQSCDDQGNCYWIGGDGARGGEFSARNIPGTFDLPHGISITASGTLLIADEDNHLIQVCDDTGGCIVRGDASNTNADCSTSLGKWCSPQDTASDSQGRFYGLDTGNNRIQIMRNDAVLTIVDVFMRQGGALGQINNARGMAIDNQDRIIIADTGNNRIQICDLDENCTGFGTLGSAVGQFNGPVGVDVDALGRIWVADTGNNRIQVCDYDGNCVAFGEEGSGDGQFFLPEDVAVHASGRVAVIDTRNDRVQFFKTEASFQMNAGLNDAWYNPVTDGQGFFITVFPDLNLVVLAWFTYDTELPPPESQADLGDAGHRWLIAVGAINGMQSNMDIEISSGGIFDVASDIQRNLDGTIKLSFDSCNSGTVEYDITSINQQGVVPIQRVAGDNVSLCESL